MLHLIDRLAGRWMDWRTDREVRNNPDLQDFNLKRFEVEGKSFELVASTQAVAILADQAATLLTESGAENFVEFRMMPRLDRNMKPILVTVQWASKLSPAEKAAMMEKRAETYRRMLVDAGLLGENEEI